jgi:hypothetical protein
MSTLVIGGTGFIGRFVVRRTSRRRDATPFPVDRATLPAAGLLAKAEVLALRLPCRVEGHPDARHGR